jgi:ribose-phosphate pyrophosphokinase
MIYLDGVPVNITVFPDKTSQVWKVEGLDATKTRHAVRWDFESEEEIIRLAQLKDLLDSYGKTATLDIMYLPYGRQDKPISNEATFALRTFAKILNGMSFTFIWIYDPHSEEALRLINNSAPIYPISDVTTIASMENIDLLCYPDKGARTKYHELFGHKFAHIYGEKVREQSTGYITRYELIGSPKDKNVLIVDDIADAGATFKILAKDLLANGAKKVVLFVSHGIFSKGIDTLFESGIHKVYTKDGLVGVSPQIEQ